MELVLAYVLTIKILLLEKYQQQERKLYTSILIVKTSHQANAYQQPNNCVNQCSILTYQVKYIRF